MGEKFKRNWKKVTGVRPDPLLKVGDVLRHPENANASGIGGIPVGDLSTIASGEILIYDGTEFVAGSGATGGGGAPTGAAGGDLSGTYPDPAVSGIQGIEVAATAPTLNQALLYDGTRYVPGDVASSLGTVILSSNGLTLTNAQGFAAASGATTLNLPATPDQGQRHYVKDVLGTAEGTPVTISGNGKNIDGESTYVLGNNYEAVTIIYEAVLGVWSVT